MADSRRIVLDRIAAAARIPQVTEGTVARMAAPAAFKDRAALREQFVAALERCSVTWELATDPVAARLQAVSRLREENIHEILSWAADQLPVPGLLEALELLGETVITPNLRAAPVKVRSQDVDGRQELLLAAEPVDVGLVAADAGLAASGTLLLQHGRDRPLLVSQMPRSLFVFVPEARLYATLEHWLDERRSQQGHGWIGRGSVALLTGSSYARDIELEPVPGVYGPRRLHVILVQEI